MVKAIIFDFDGVIGDTYDINFEVSKIFNSDITEQDFIDHHLGNVYHEPKIKFSSEDIPVFFAEQKQRFTSEHLFPLRELLAELKEEYQLFVVSSTIDENVKHFLELGDYHYFFEEILGATTHKSKVTKFQMIFDKYHLRPTECLFVTDTINDIKEAREVNLPTIGVTWGYHEKDLLLSEKPTAIAHTVEELRQIIADLKMVNL